MDSNSFERQVVTENRMTNENTTDSSDRFGDSGQLALLMDESTLNHLDLVDKIVSACLQVLKGSATFVIGVIHIDAIVDEPDAGDCYR